MSLPQKNKGLGRGSLVRCFLSRAQSSAPQHKACYLSSFYFNLVFKGKSLAMFSKLALYVRVHAVLLPQSPERL